MLQIFVGRTAMTGFLTCVIGEVFAQIYDPIAV